MIVQAVEIDYKDGKMVVAITTNEGVLLKTSHDILEIDENTPERMARLARARQIIDLGIFT